MIKVCFGDGTESPGFDTLADAKMYSCATRISYEIVDSTTDKVLYTSQDEEDEANYTEALIGTNWATVPVLLERMK